MKNGYDQFFEVAKKNAQRGASPKRSSQSQGSQAKSQAQAQQAQDLLRSKIQLSADSQSLRNRSQGKKRKSPFPTALFIVTLMAFLGSGYVFLHIDEVESLISKVEVGFFESSLAQSERDPQPAGTSNSPSAQPPKSGAASGTATNSSAAGSETPGANAESEDHFRVLAERKRQLDEREAELARVEAELMEQKKELEKKMQELEQTRRSISSVLEDRVKLDEQRVDTLVQMYSKMRPPQAAKIFETMDEGLAIEILGRMKKDVAANIMNLIKPEKAQTFSEKFAGYKAK